MRCITEKSFEIEPTMCSVGFADLGSTRSWIPSINVIQILQMPTDLRAHDLYTFLN